MAMWATKRKLIYFGLFFIILAIAIGFPVFSYLYEPPTCFDTTQNGTEQGVDCGGTCVKLCKPLELRPVVLWQQSFRVSTGIYTAAAYIQNPNLSAESFAVPYTFKLYDANNQVIAERSGKTYIPAGKSFAVVEAGITAPDKTVIRASFELDPEFSWYVAKTAKPELIVNNLDVSNTETTPFVDADISNETYTDIGRVTIAALVYDVDGNAIAASKTFITNLYQQSNQHVTFSWPQPFSKLISRVELIPIIE
jgi:hypothetical protein